MNWAIFWLSGVWTSNESWEGCQCCFKPTFSIEIRSIVNRPKILSRAIFFSLESPHDHFLAPVQFLIFAQESFHPISHSRCQVDLLPPTFQPLVARLSWWTLSHTFLPKLNFIYHSAARCYQSVTRGLFYVPKDLEMVMLGVFIILRCCRWVQANSPKRGWN